MKRRSLLLAPLWASWHNVTSMALREDIQKRIDKKRAEIVTLEGQIKNATIYIQALEDTLKMLPRETAEPSALAGSNGSLRAGSKVDKAREAIQRAGKPLHVTELLPSIGRPNNASNRAALSGSLSAYARKHEIFTRPAPNTFGLIELQEKHSRSAAPSSGPPPHFGKDDLSQQIDEEIGATLTPDVNDDDVPF